MRKRRRARLIQVTLKAGQNFLAVDVFFVINLSIDQAWILVTSPNKMWRGLALSPLSGVFCGVLTACDLHFGFEVR